MAIEDAPLHEQMRWAADVLDRVNERYPIATWGSHNLRKQADNIEAEDAAAAAREQQVEELARALFDARYPECGSVACGLFGRLPRAGPRSHRCWLVESRCLMRAQCISCNRAVTVRDGCWTKHSVSDNEIGDTCQMSYQHIPITGLTARDYVSRAHLVGNLAWQIQDQDPAVVHAYLSGLDKDELLRVAVIALAGIPVADNTIPDIYEWVCHLPVARQDRAA